ncbi:MAG: hypothetical protein R2867_03825 [Caldilineaceae bacterium]
MRPYRRNPDNRLAFAQIANDTGLGNAGLRFNTEAFKRIGDQSRSSVLLEAEFGVGMDIAPPGDQLLVDSFCLF